MNLLLDTCVFLWLTRHPHLLSQAAKTAINDRGNVLFLSHVSEWEIALKYRKGKLPLPGAPRFWIPTQTTFFHIQPLAVNLDDFYLSTDIPSVHADPFDRLIAAQAVSRRMTVITLDHQFASLGVSTIW